MRVIRGTQDKFLRPHKKEYFCDTYYHSVEHLTVNQGVAGSSPKTCKHVRGSHIGATILYPNTKVLGFQGLFVFLGGKYNPISPLHLFPDLMDLNLRLQPQVEKIKPLIYCINERCVL